MPARVPPLDPAVIPAAPRERRRLQCYLALLLGDGSALFAGFVVAGSRPGAASGSYLAELLLPVFLTFALYNGAYSRAALERARFGTGQALIALAMAAATVAFIALSLGAEVQAARGLFLAGLGLAALFVVAIRALLRGFVLWRCGGVVVDQLVIADGGPALALRGARRLDARQMRLVPALDDPAALHRIGLALHGADRVVVSCAPQPGWPGPRSSRAATLPAKWSIKRSPSLARTARGPCADRGCCGSRSVHSGCAPARSSAGSIWPWRVPDWCWPRRCWC